MPSCRLALLLAATTAISATEAAAQYRDPPAPIAQILDAPPTPGVSISPDRRLLVLLDREGLPPITEVAAPELRLAGVRIDPRTNGGSRDIFLKGLRIITVDGEGEKVVTIPAGARISNPQWSPTSRHLFFTVVRADGHRAWLADAATGVARELSNKPLNAALGAPCSWATDGSELLCRFIPDGRGAAPADATPTGPAIQEAGGRATPNRTYADLLTNSADEAKFDHYATSQLTRLALDGTITPLGAPAIYAGASFSPDGRFILVQQVKRPYSYVVPMGRFPRHVAVWDRGGRPVQTIADLPLQDAIPPDFDAVATGRRNISWRPGAPATLIFAEALDGGNPRNTAEKRDRVFTLEAPYSAPPVPVIDLEYRYGGVTAFADGRLLVDESWFRTRRNRTWFFWGGGAPRALWDLSSEDRYADPGSPVMTLGPNGWVIQTSADGRSIFLDGQGASSEGERPFLRRFDLATGRTEELFRSQAPFYEDPIALLDPDGRRILTRRESVDSVPNYWVRDLRTRRAPRQITRFADPAPQFAGLRPELITYQRADGVQLSATMYLPPGYTRAQGRLPFFFWAYPQEFKSAQAASQVIGSPYRFTRPAGSSHLFLLTQGYGILDGPTMPIVGEGGAEPNDTYVAQLVSSAAAAIDKVVEMGVADRDQIAVGGHSYGAFMTANLLAHSDLFRAGIARSGAYNRTLTPFGFQSEERTYWQARETYDEMSPFTYADSLKEPLLLIHGEADNNSGTFPIQTDRMFAAVKGNGGTVRMVMLPAESHGYRARESVGHVLWEMSQWLDRWVKGPPRS
jgi:dipeptidyl aminopeptidase/acylaminoacyl peptidase